MKESSLPTYMLQKDKLACSTGNDWTVPVKIPNPPWQGWNSPSQGHRRLLNAHGFSRGMGDVETSIVWCVTCREEYDFFHYKIAGTISI